VADRTARQSPRLELAAWALLTTQVLHVFVPAETDAGSATGPLVGLVLLVATMAAILALRTARSWAAALAGWTGAAVAAGFIAYHALPVRSPVTNPYLGEAVGALAWSSVALAVAAGLWAARESGIGRTGGPAPA
jgi:hypothetical protein